MLLKISSILAIITTLSQLTIANLETIKPNPNGSINNRIVSGNIAERGQFPWHAVLYVVNANGQSGLCGGSLIDENWVVTAAHCTEEAEVIKIGLGIENRWNQQFFTYSRKFYTNENYDTEHFHNDISLIQLQKPAPMSDLIEIISLPPSSEDFLRPGDIAETCGFGRIHDHNHQTPHTLRWLKLRLISNEECINKFGPDYIYDGKVCASAINRKQQICDGDSGGGLIANQDGEKYLVGIISIGRVDICSGAPSGYERIFPHLDWIHEIIHF